MGPILAVGAAASVYSAFTDIEAVQPEFVPFQTEAQVTASIRPAFDAVNREAAALAESRAAEMVGKRLVAGILIDNPDAKWTITEPTREWLRQAITAAFEDGLSPAQLGDRIRSDYAFSKARAELIAKTEVGNLNVWSHAASAMAMGATHKASFLSADHDQDDFCDEAEASGEVPIDYDYGFGLKWPLYHPRCECSETFYWRKKKATTIQ
jgi:hypothetical protein